MQDTITVIGKPSFTQIYNIFLRSEEIFSLHEKFTIIMLDSFAGDKEQSFPSYATLAKACGYSRDTAMRTIKSLVEKGFVIKEPRISEEGNATSNLYTLDYGTILPLCPPLGGSRSQQPPQSLTATTGSRSQQPRVVAHSNPKKIQEEIETTKEDGREESSLGFTDLSHNDQKSSPSPQMSTLSRGESQSSHLISSMIEKVKTNKTRLSLNDHKQQADQRRSEALNAQEALLNSQGYDKSQTKIYRERVLKEYTKKLHFLDPLFTKYAGDLEDCLETFKGRVKPNWHRCTKCSEKWLKRGENLCSDCKNEEAEEWKAKQAQVETKKAQELKERKAQDEQVSERLKDFENQQAFKSWLKSQGYPEYTYDLTLARRMWIESLQGGGL